MGNPAPAVRTPAQAATDVGVDGWTATMGGSLPSTVFSTVAVLSRGDDWVVVSAVVPRSAVRAGFPAWGLRAGGLPRPTASSAAGPAVWWSARGDRFGRSGVEAFATPAEGPGEPSELDSPLEGDGPSARATPLANPTATQADSNNALRGQLHTSRPVGMHCIQLTAGSVLIWQCRLKIAVRAMNLRVARPCLQSSRC
jgi:hypothetical protein